MGVATYRDGISVIDVAQIQLAMTFGVLCICWNYTMHQSSNIMYLMRSQFKFEII